MKRITLWFRVRASRPRRGIQLLQQYVDRPANRHILDHFHQPRKENPQP
ncbi:hypothetical protein ABZT16_11350 [Streptomyces flaveolus]